MCAIELDVVTPPTIKEFLLETFPDEPKEIMESIANSAKRKLRLTYITDIENPDMLMRFCSIETDKYFDMGRVGRVYTAIYEYLGFENNVSKSLKLKDPVIKEGQFCNNQEIETVRLPNPVKVCAGAFKDCRSLKSVHFDFGDGDVVIEYGAFDCCINLKDIHFMLKKEAHIKIDDEAFRNTDQQITFHVPAFKEVFEGLEDFAKKHNYKIKRHL